MAEQDGGGQVPSRHRQQTGENRSRHQGDHRQRVEAIAARVTQADAAELDQDPGEHDSVGDGHQQRDQGRLDHQAAADRQVRRPCDPRRQPVKEIQRGRSPDQVRPARGRRGRPLATPRRHDPRTVLALGHRPEEHRRHQKQKRHVVPQTRTGRAPASAPPAPPAPAPARRDSAPWSRAAGRPSPARR